MHCDERSAAPMAQQMRSLFGCCEAEHAAKGDCNYSRASKRVTRSRASSQATVCVRGTSAYVLHTGHTCHLNMGCCTCVTRPLKLRQYAPRAGFHFGALFTSFITLSLFEGPFMLHAQRTLMS